MFAIKHIKKFLSIFIATTILGLTSLSSIATYADTNNNDSETKQSVYYMDNTKIVIDENSDKVNVSVYINEVLDHTSQVLKNSGEIIEKNSDGTTNISNVEDYVTNDNLNIITPLRDTAPSGYSYLTEGRGYTPNPNLTAYLWHYNKTTQGTARTLKFSKGTAIGTISGILISLIPGINVVSVITALGAGIVGAAIGTAIDGEIWAVDNYKYIKGTCNNKTCLNTYRFSRFAKVINKKTGNSELQFVGKYGNWSEYSTLLYQTVNNYVTGRY